MWSADECGNGVLRALSVSIKISGITKTLSFSRFSPNNIYKWGDAGDGWVGRANGGAGMWCTVFESMNESKMYEMAFTMVGTKVSSHTSNTPYTYKSRLKCGSTR